MNSEMIKTRDEYIELIKRELLGPGSEISIPDADHELISTSPDARYSIGVLFPRNNKMDADNDDSARLTGSDSTGEDEVIEEGSPEDLSSSEDRPSQITMADEDNLDEEIGLAAQNMPSSAGITFFAKGNSEVVKCNVSFATYRKATASDCRIPFYPEDPEHYTVPPFLDTIAVFEKESNSLRLIRGGVTRKEIRELREKDLLDSDEFGLFDALFKLASQLQRGYVRIPHNVSVNLDFSSADYIDNNRDLDHTKAKLTALRRKTEDNLYSITVMIVNDNEERANGLSCIFQPEIRIDSESNGFSFADYSGIIDFDLLDNEEKSLALQYRNKRVFATGLGTSANWNVDEFGKGEVFSDFFPVSEVPGMDFTIPNGYSVPDNAFSMKYLSDMDKSAKAEKLENLKSLVSAYDQWIDKLCDKAKVIDEKYNNKYHEIAEKNIQGCRAAAIRMTEGIEKLDSDNNAWVAFQLANRAMYMQRAHIKLQEKLSRENHDCFPNDDYLSGIIEAIDYKTIDKTIHDRYAWRPFQLAFLLMSVNSVCDEESADREIVDLIWFPTGGGKTEAYLGLTALTIFYRRLQYPSQSGGTAVIMRYTLRLLAAQQFTRASTLICACEQIRRDAISRKPQYGKYPLGDERITIGLWIGREHTPNTNKQAKDELAYLQQANVNTIKDIKDKHNKFQVLKCPWCGTKLVKERRDAKLVGMFGYRMKNNNHFELFCPQESCYFNSVGALPIQIVDEELYDNPPTLLFGTVDKFAMLPWKKDIGQFFAVGTKNRSPELIIQDELHLISGPLGTMVGLYEAAIDKICAGKGIKTKIVASTATIRRAAEQCSALYDREVNQYPHPGLDAEDSFFAREAVIDYSKGSYGRKYIGLMPSGKTKAMMEIRTIAALMQRIKDMDLPDEVRDKYWTLTVYFNSLKDLGKCSTLVEDDVKDFLKRMVYRTGRAYDARVITNADELTSRVSTTELNETLDKLEKLTYSKENIENKKYASNILLATNMISVGIDVARLNVMVLVGQPKLTSEYIQASSRIGRSYPGVAFALYDGSKSRDRSHFEQFKPYHESFYRYVEPTGVTPFSKPARDRALHAVIISMLRMLGPGLYNEKDAAGFKRNKYQDIIDDITNFITGRNSSIISKLSFNMEDNSSVIREEIDAYLEKWEQMAMNYGEDHFVYGEKYMVQRPDADDGRLLKAYNTDPQDEAFDTMTSMRNVDATVLGNVLIWE